MTLIHRYEGFGDREVFAPSQNRAVLPCHTAHREAELCKICTGPQRGKRSNPAEEGALPGRRHSGKDQLEMALHGWQHHDS